MPRPRSNDKRAAIVSAATRVFAAQGLGAATATIAQEAGVSNGSLFTYFDTKADLLNQLYLELKTDMEAGALAGLPDGSDVREQLLYMWSRWLRWATAFPEKRRALAHLEVCDDITAATHQAASQAMAGIAEILERSREHGPMRDVPLMFMVGLASAIADTTIDFIIDDPGHADILAGTGFDALWRMIA
jgi:AcrR family transcriptional regulator